MLFSEIAGDSGIFVDGDWIEKKDQDPNGKVRLIQLADIGEGHFLDKSNRFITESKAEELHCTFLKKGDILIARLGEPLCKACVFPYEGLYITAVDIAILRIDSDRINPEYIVYLVNSPWFKEAIKPYESGTTRKRISRKNLNRIDIDIPSIAKQNQVVSQIEESLSQLDSAVETLEKTKQQLEVYRQAVLKEAFNNSRSNFKLSICDFAEVSTGATPLKSRADYYGGSIPWVTSTKVNDEYVYEPTDFITELAIKETNCRVFPPHTLLVAMYGEGKTRGKCSELMIPAATNQALAAILINKDSDVIKDYLKWFLIYNYGNIRLKSVGGVQPNINLSIIKKLEIPVFSKDVQKKIVRKIDSQMTYIEDIEQTVILSLQQSEALRQSILKQAFEED